MKLLLVAVLFALGAVVFPVQVRAQNETSLSVAPAILELAVNQGDVIERILYVQNGGPTPVPVSIEIQSLLSGDSLLLNESTRNHDAKNWIELAESQFILSSQERRAVPLKISVPQDASSGGYYAQISVRGLSLETSSQQTSSIIVPEVSVSVLMTLAGEINESIYIEPVDIVPVQTSPGSEHTVSMDIENTGNVHGLVAPELVVEKNGIEEILRFAPRVLLPGSSATFTEIWTSPKEFGSYQAHVRVRYGNDAEYYTTKKESLYVTPSYTKLAITAISVWAFIYIYRHRFTIVPATKVLFGIEKPKKKKRRKKKH